eukprot:IDg1047t1
MGAGFSLECRGVAASTLRKKRHPVPNRWLFALCKGATGLGANQSDLEASRDRIASSSLYSRSTSLSSNLPTRFSILARLAYFLAAPVQYLSRG